jgi:hypothetical protein
MPQPIQHNEPMVHINAKYICNRIARIIITGYTLTAFYLYSYIVSSEDAKQTDMFKLFLAYIITYTVSGIIFSIMESIAMYQNYNKIIPKKIWNIMKLHYLNRFPLSLIKIIPFVMNSVAIYYIVKFIPLRECSAYSEFDGIENNRYACISMKIIAIMTLISFCFLAFMLLILTCCCGCLCYFSGINEPRRIYRSVRSALDDANITTYLPMQNLPSSDTQCSICWETAAEDANRQWVNLTSCNHKFHTDCLTQWTNIHPTCPLCRVHIVMSAPV